MATSSCHKKLVEVKEHHRDGIGCGLFIAAERVVKGTRVAFFGGQVITCKDNNGCKVRERPRGIYILCLNPDVKDPDDRIYMDCSTLPPYGARGFEKFTAHFANSSHPLAKPPFNEPNAIFESCPDEPEMSCLRLTQDLYCGDEVLWDYHYQLVKKGIYGSCKKRTCGDCRSALRTPGWSEEEQRLLQHKRRKVDDMGGIYSPPASPVKYSNSSVAGCFREEEVVDVGFIYSPPASPVITPASREVTSGSTRSMETLSSSAQDVGFRNSRIGTVTTPFSPLQLPEQQKPQEVHMGVIYSPPASSLKASTSQQGPSGSTRLMEMQTPSVARGVRFWNSRSSDVAIPFSPLQLPRQQVQANVPSAGKDLFSATQESTGTDATNSSGSRRILQERKNKETVQCCQVVEPSSSVSSTSTAASCHHAPPRSIFGMLSGDNSRSAHFSPSSATSGSTAMKLRPIRKWEYHELAFFLRYKFQCSRRCKLNCKSLNVMKLDTLWENWNKYHKVVPLKQVHDEVFLQLCNIIGPSGKEVTTYRYLGRDVCANAYSLGNCISRRSFYRMRKEVADGCLSRNGSQAGLERSESLLDSADKENVEVIQR